MTVPTGTLPPAGATAVMEGGEKEQLSPAEAAEHIKAALLGGGPIILEK